MRQWVGVESPAVTFWASALSVFLGLYSEFLI